MITPNIAQNSTDPSSKVSLLILFGTGILKHGKTDNLLILSIYTTLLEISHAINLKTCNQIWSLLATFTARQQDGVT
jgi:hypothetical protein